MKRYGGERMNQSDSYEPTAIRIITDGELKRRLDEFFENHPKLKRGWWYREAIMEKLEREEVLR
jgi:predicted transcriptional regulator